MLNDTIISGLLNLFALLSARYNSRMERCVTLISNYLESYFGIKNKANYIGLFTDLHELYASEELDKDSIVLSISNNIKKEIVGIKLKILLLRLMEFCKSTSDTFEPDGELVKVIATHFGVDDNLLQVFIDFVEDHATDAVKLQRFEDYDGYIRTLWIEREHKMLFTYMGNDNVLMNDVPVLTGVFQIWQESFVLKNNKGASIYYSSVKQAYDKEIHNHVVFCGRDINFKYSNSDAGIHNLSFDLKTGELVAIMGGSGTGKTTMLSLLNGTLQPQSGSITINGHSTNEPAAKALIGFVPQDDLLIEELTVYQNLYYTARLCFDGMSEEELHERVINLLTSLGLEATKDLKVGSPLNKTISGGQRKRLNIALELIREPAVLMLDEPTSGLSSADTEHVVGLLKEQTYKGCLVIANIHQPSSDVYKLFDRLWLLDRGGYPIFDGNPIDAITYFKTAANYADADYSTCPFCGTVKPETVLSIIDEKTIDNAGNISTERKTSPQEWHKRYLKSRGAMENVKETPVPHSDQHKPNAIKQFSIQFERNFKTKITNKQYLLITLLEAPLLAVICSALTHYAPETGYTFMDNINFVSFLFMAVIVATFIGMSGSAEEIIRDRALLKREKFLQLSYGAYISSKIVLLALVSILQTGLFVIISQLIMGFHDLFFEWWLILFASAFVANLTGLILSQCLNSVVAIYITIPLLLIPQILLCGVVVDFNDLNGRSTTGNVPLIGNIIPSRWAYEALAVCSFTDNVYEAPLFDYHRQQYQDQFNRMSYLYELESQLEKRKDEQKRGKEVDPAHEQTLITELPNLAAKAGIEPYHGDYSYPSLRAYFKQADQVFMQRSNRATLNADKIVCSRIKLLGIEGNKTLKANYFNTKLESVLINATSDKTHLVVNGHIVPMIGQIYLDPPTHDGNAPFYSHCKQIGNTKIPTPWFNLIILTLMAVITAVLIYTDFPGRKLRKN